jgi:hypothetical protein
LSEYDSRPDTEAHIERVRQLLGTCMATMHYRATIHDRSKLQSPEKDAFDIATPKLKGLTYGSDEYKQALADLKPALEHHYANNSHHPEHYPNGVAGMDLFDLIEMLMDWKAAGERHADGNIQRSLEINEGRFNIEPQLAQVLKNTVQSMGWVD